MKQETLLRIFWKNQSYRYCYVYTHKCFYDTMNYYFCLLLWHDCQNIKIYAITRHEVKEDWDCRCCQHIMAGWHRSYMYMLGPCQHNCDVHGPKEGKYLWHRCVLQATCRNVFQWALHQISLFRWSTNTWLLYRCFKENKNKESLRILVNY